MRLFPSLHDAILEIRRDLVKSPIVSSNRVQHMIVDQRTVEATCYSYAIMTETFPKFCLQLVELGAEHFPFWKENRYQLGEWLAHELNSRVNEDGPVSDPPEAYHPTLQNMQEGADWSYHYGERLVGWKMCIAAQLDAFPTTRRAFWPIFHPIDAIRANRPTRIPCTLGYYWTLRPEPDMPKSLLLECTLLQRSCDFEKYWLSDVWLAYMMTLDLKTQLSPEDYEVKMGNFNHVIMSFHRFLPEGEEVY